MRSIAAAFGAMLALASAGNAQAPAHDDHAHGAGLGQLGKVTFPVSCTAEAGRRFETAMGALHSFWWEEGDAAFKRVLEPDADCAMAYWGVAMNAWGNPFAGGPAEPALSRGAEAAAKAIVAVGEDRAGAGVHRRGGRALSRRRQDNQRRPAPGLRRHHGAGVPGFSQGHRSRHLPRPRPDRHRAQDRHHLRPAEARGRDSQSPVCPLSPAPGPGPLHHPLHRFAPAGPPRPRRRAAVRQDRAGRAPRPAHAVAHLHPAGLLGRDRRLESGGIQRRCGQRQSQSGPSGRRGVTRARLRGLWLSPAGAGLGRPGDRRHRAERRGSRGQGRSGRLQPNRDGSSTFTGDWRLAYWRLLFQ